jgi:hypothetical protein
MGSKLHRIRKISTMKLLLEKNNPGGGAMYRHISNGGSLTFVCTTLLTNMAQNN